ncbi:MAG: DinB family protein [Bacillota bacterium]|nr:DinB family protein [Bacillota bacterium]
MTLDVYLDGSRQGHWMGHFLEEPGCVWIAPTKEEAVGRAQEEITGFFSWLRGHGDRPGASLPTGKHEVRAAAFQEVQDFGQSGAAVGFFEPDREPATQTNIVTAVRRLGYARRDLLEAVAGLPDAALDWQPPGGKRTLRANLHHVRNCHGWYLTRVLGWSVARSLLPEPWPEATFASLEWVMRRAVNALLELPEELRSGVHRAETPEEDWTARKMLRRFVEHEREHVEVVRRTVGLWKAAGG